MTWNNCHISTVVKTEILLKNVGSKPTFDTTLLSKIAQLVNKLNNFITKDNTCTITKHHKVQRIFHSYNIMQDIRVQLLLTSLCIQFILRS